MNVQIDDETTKKLKYLAANVFAIPGEKPHDLNELIHKLIQRKWDEYNPPDYAPFYERR